MGTKYTTTTISGYNSSPPSDDGATTEANRLKWSNHVSKLGNPLKTAIESINTKLVSAMDQEPTTKTSNYTTTSSDHNTAILATSGVTVSLGDAAAMGAGYIVTIKNNASAGTVTISRITGANKIDRTAADVTLDPNTADTFVSDGVDYYTLGGYVSVDPLIAEALADSAAGYGIIGLSATNDATTPDEKMDVSVQQVTVMRESTGRFYTIRNPSAIENDLTVLASGSGGSSGRTQTSAFGNNATVHYYWIWNGTDSLVVASPTAPPTGPTADAEYPAAYHSWAYLFSVVLDGTADLFPVWVRGSKVFYREFKEFGHSFTSTAEVGLNIGLYVPAIADFWQYSIIYYSLNASTGTHTMVLRLITGVDFDEVINDHQSNAALQRNSRSGDAPYVASTAYLRTDASVTDTGFLRITGYRVPNGG